MYRTYFLVIVVASFLCKDNLEANRFSIYRLNEKANFQRTFRLLPDMSIIKTTTIPP